MPRSSPARLARKAPRVALIVKRSLYRTYVRERKDPHLVDLLSKRDPTVARLVTAHEAHERGVEAVTRSLEELGAKTEIIVGAGQPFDASSFDLVVTVGGDGTLLRSSHRVGNIPILGINSAPGHSVGFFCGATSENALETLRRALDGSLKQAVLTRMKVCLNGDVIAGRVLNDTLFCHASPAATSRYLIALGRVREEHKSSGFWIGPAAGSTAAQRSAGGRVLPLTSRRLQLVVREAYTPQGETYRLRHALIPDGATLEVRSKMREGRLFIDGPEQVVSFRFGDVVEFTQADEPLTLLGISARRKWATHAAPQKRPRTPT
jgi:NAD+ kinase